MAQERRSPRAQAQGTGRRAKRGQDASAQPPRIILDTPDRAKALEATRDCADAFFYNVLAPFNPAPAVDDFMGALEGSPAAGELLSFRFLGATWPPKWVACVLGGLVWARARQLEQQMPRTTPEPFHRSFGELRDAAQTLEATRVPKSHLQQLRSRALVQWMIEANRGRPRRHKRWEPHQYLAEAIEALPGVARQAKSDLARRLAREVLGLPIRPSQMHEALRRARTRRAREAGPR